MHLLRTRRWSPGIVEKRWRHVFWILPLGGVAIGLLVGALDFKRKDISTGFVQFMPSSVMEISDVIAAFKSNDAIEATTHDLDLPRRWKKTPEDSTEALRRLTRVNSVRGTSLIEVSVVGTKSAETVEICNSVIENTITLLTEKASSTNLSRLEQLKTTVTKLEAEAEDKRIRLTPIIGHGPSASNSPTPPPNLDFIQRQTEFSEARLALTNAKTAQLAQEMRERFEANPVIVRRWPNLANQTSILDVLRHSLLFTAIGLVAGVGLTVIVAYLLEAAFPRKTLPSQAVAT